MAFGIGQLLKALDLENRFAQYLATGSLSSFITSLLGASNQATAQALLGLGPYATLTSIPTPTNPTDPANKSYVDALSQGLDVKPSALVATTANITLSGEQTIDGVLTSASIVLVKNQTTANQNGLYTSAAGAWARIAAMNTWAQVPGAFCFVEQGTANADTGWVCTSDAGGTLGTTSIGWSKFSSAGGSLLASNNLSDVVSASTALTNLGGGTTGVSLFQAATAAVATAIMNAFVGDSGSGGTKGMVPAPATGDAAANKFLGAGGSFVAVAISVITGLGTNVASALSSAVNAANGFVRLDGTGKLPAVDGSALTNVGSGPGKSLSVPTTSYTTADITVSGTPSRIFIGLNKVSLNASADLTLLLVTGGGAITTGYTGKGVTFATTTSATFNPGTSSVQITNGAAAADLVSGTITLIHTGGNVWSYSWSLAGGANSYKGEGNVSLGAQITAVRLGGGTFDAGSIGGNWD